MKITDYGVWFHSGHHWIKEPDYQRFYTVHCRGKEIGHGTPKNGFLFFLDSLAKINMSISPEAPWGGGPVGKRCELWDFPKGYIPTESDFKDLS